MRRLFKQWRIKLEVWYANHLIKSGKPYSVKRDGSIYIYRRAYNVSKCAK